MTKNSQAASASDIRQSSHAIARPELFKAPIPDEQPSELEQHSISQGTTDTETLKPCVGPQETTDADTPQPCVRSKTTAKKTPTLATDTDIKNICTAITSLELNTAHRCGKTNYGAQDDNSPRAITDTDDQLPCVGPKILPVKSYTTNTGNSSETTTGNNPRLEPDDAQKLSVEALGTKKSISPEGNQHEQAQPSASGSSINSRSLQARKISNDYSPSPYVELISLFTDVAGIVRDKSGFRIITNFCYTLNRDSKPVIIKLRTDGEEFQH